MRSKTSLATLGVALSCLAGTPAYAQLVLAPPIIGKTVMAPQDSIQLAIQDELGASGIKPVELTTQLLKALEKCKNKMSCLATAGKAAGATHVLHTIMAERDGQVLAQLTLLDVKTKKPADTLRAKTNTDYKAIERGVREAARNAILALLASDDFPKPKSPVVVAPTPTATPSPTPTPPVVAVAPSPSPTPVTIGRAPPIARQVPPSSGAPVAPPVTVTAPNPGAGKGPNYLAFTVTGAGAAAAIVGGVLLGIAQSDASARDSTPQVFIDERTRLNDAAFAKQGAGLGLLAGGGGAVLIGVIFWATGIGATDLGEAASDPNALVSLTPTADGFAVHW